MDSLKFIIAIVVTHLVISGCALTPPSSAPVVHNIASKTSPEYSSVKCSYERPTGTRLRAYVCRTGAQALHQRETARAEIRRAVHRQLADQAARKTN